MSAGIERENRLVCWYLNTYAMRAMHPTSILDSMVGTIMWSEVSAKMKEFGYADDEVGLREEWDAIRTRSEMDVFEEHVRLEVKRQP